MTESHCEEEEERGVSPALENLSVLDAEGGWSMHLAHQGILNKGWRVQADVRVKERWIVHT